MNVTTTTGGDLLALVLKDAGVVGVGQTPLAEDTQDALSRLNLMLGEWAQDRWMVYHLLDVSVVATGATSYTIGLGGNFNTPRPDIIEAAFVRQLQGSAPQPPDTPLRIIRAREDYSRITLKTLQTFPQYLFYDPAFPLGLVYPWPVPNSGQYEVHVLVKDQLAQVTNLAAILLLPPAYYAALHYNLVCRTRGAYQMPPDPTMVALAENGLNVVRGSNFAIPELQMPNAVIQHAAGYNIYSDTGGG